MLQVLQLVSGHQLMRLENSGNNLDVGALLSTEQQRTVGYVGWKKAVERTLNWVD